MNEATSSVEFERGVRAAVAAGRLLASHRALLDVIAREWAMDWGLDPECVSRHLDENPAIGKALRLIAEIEGREPPAKPILAWPVGGHLGLDREQYDAMKKAGVVTFGDLVGRTPLDLVVLPGFAAWCIRSIEEKLKPAGLELAEQRDEPAEGSPIFGFPWDRLMWDLPKNTPGALALAGIETVSDLLGWTPDELLDLPGVGLVAVDRVERCLDYFGLALAEEAVAV